MSDITRRDALRMLAATGAAATVGCVGAKEGEAVASSPAAPVPDPVRAVTPLPSSGPWPTLDPFLFCVHHDDRYPQANGRLGPKASLEGREIGRDFANLDGWNMYHGRHVPGFPRHPHRGFETVTLVRQGLIDHADSLGAAARYGDGDVQWLTAGDGINHAEMFPLFQTERANPIDFFQIWVNLPAADKRVPPNFAMLWRDQIPVVQRPDGQGKVTEVTVVAGDLDGVKAPAPPPHSWASQAERDVAIWTMKMAAEATFTLPAVRPGTGRALYVVTDAPLRIGAREVPGRQQVVLSHEGPVRLTAGAAPCEVLLLQGRPIGEPVVQHGPFVMNSREEIQQAYRDYRQTQFGGWPWPSTEPVHGEARRRFAKYIDGRVETPA